MKIAVLGGTGKLGMGFAVRLTKTGHETVIGSRETAKAQEAAKTIGADVFAAFQTISHRVLRHVEISHDVLVAGAAARKSEVMELIRSMGLHPVDAGPIEVAGHLERMTVLLLSINKANKVKESGIKI